MAEPKQRNISVAVRFRPLNDKENNEGQSSIWNFHQPRENIVVNTRDDKKFWEFDHVFTPQDSTDKIFGAVAKDIVHSVMDGVNGTIFAYGQTSSGKTFTMHGDQKTHGIIPQAVMEVFNLMESKTSSEFLMSVNFMEIYNERIIDLLSNRNTDEQDLKLFDKADGTLEVRDLLSRRITRGPEDIFDALREGESKRHTGATAMNERSSRSHTILRFNIESRELHGNDTTPTGAVKQSQLNLVDLAGSEALRLTQATGDRRREGANINKSLLALSGVIKQLSEVKNENQKVTGFRDSKLTRLLQASLGGNSQTTVITAASPASGNLYETTSTLDFALRAKQVKNRVKVNIYLGKESMMQLLQKEIEELKSKLGRVQSQESMNKLNNLLSENAELVSQKESLNKKLQECTDAILGPKSVQEAFGGLNNRRHTCAGFQGFGSDFRKSFVAFGKSSGITKRPVSSLADFPESDEEMADASDSNQNQRMSEQRMSLHKEKSEFVLQKADFSKERQAFETEKQEFYTDLQQERAYIEKERQDLHNDKLQFDQMVEEKVVTAERVEQLEQDILHYQSGGATSSNKETSEAGINTDVDQRAENLQTDLEQFRIQKEEFEKGRLEFITKEANMNSQLADVDRRESEMLQKQKEVDDKWQSLQTIEEGAELREQEFTAKENDLKLREENLANLKAQLEQNKGQLEEQLVAQSANLDDMTQEKNTLEDKCTMLEQKIEELNSMIQAGKGQLEKLNSDLSTSSSRVQELENILTESNPSELKLQLEQQSSENRQLTESCEVEKRKYGELNVQKEKVSQELATAQNKITELENGLKEKESALEQETNTKKRKFSEMEEEHTKERQDKDAKIIELEQQLTVTNNTIEARVQQELENRSKEVVAQKEELVKKEEAMQAREQEVANRMKEVEEAIQAREQEVANRMKEVEEKAANASASDQQVNKLAEQLAEAQANITNQKAQLAKEYQAILNKNAADLHTQYKNEFKIELGKKDQLLEDQKNKWKESANAKHAEYQQLLEKSAKDLHERYKGEMKEILAKRDAIIIRLEAEKKSRNMNSTQSLEQAEALDKAKLEFKRKEQEFEKKMQSREGDLKKAAKILDKRAEEQKNRESAFSNGQVEDMKVNVRKLEQELMKQEADLLSNMQKAKDKRAKLEVGFKWLREQEEQNARERDSIIEAEKVNKEELKRLSDVAAANATRMRDLEEQKKKLDKMERQLEECSKQEPTPAPLLPKPIEAATASGSRSAGMNELRAKLSDKEIESHLFKQKQEKAHKKCQFLQTQVETLESEVSRLQSRLEEERKQKEDDIEKMQGMGLDGGGEAMEVDVATLQEQYLQKDKRVHELEQIVAKYERERDSHKYGMERTTQWSQRLDKQEEEIQKLREQNQVMKEKEDERKWRSALEQDINSLRSGKENAARPSDRPPLGNVDLNSASDAECRQQ